MVLQNYQNFTEMTSNMIYIVAFVVGLTFPRKVHLNAQCPRRTPAGLSTIVLIKNHFLRVGTDVTNPVFKSEVKMEC